MIFSEQRPRRTAAMRGKPYVVKRGERTICLRQATVKTAFRFSQQLTLHLKLLSQRQSFDSTARAVGTLGMHSAFSKQLEAAVLTLVGHGTLKDRLCAAFCDHLDDLKEQELPAEVQGEFASMSRAMHSARALPGDSVVRASVRKFSNHAGPEFCDLDRSYLRAALAGADRHPRGTGPPGELLAQRSSLGRPGGLRGERGRRGARQARPQFLKIIRS